MLKLRKSGSINTATVKTKAMCSATWLCCSNMLPLRGEQQVWCILLMLLSIALLIAESSMNNLQSVSIVAAFPIGAVIVMIAASFLKDAKKHQAELETDKKR